MTRIAVIGTGYVGLVTSACLADQGCEVTGLDRRQDLVDALELGEVPIHEAGLAPLLEAGRNSDRLRFTTSYAAALAGAEIAILCVDTPMSETGAADTSRLMSAVDSVAAAASSDLVVVIKSTAPVGTARDVHERLSRHPGRFTVVSNPEFLQQGHAVDDFRRPRRVVVGTETGEPIRELRDLYEPLGSPVITTTWETAELAKYASNAFLATKISFINEIAAICDAVGADVREVADAMGLDPRIGRSFLNAGIGYGGSCLPKDVAALVHTAREGGHDALLLSAVASVNDLLPSRTVSRLYQALGSLKGKRIALLGLAFKPETDDLRSAPSITLAAALQAEGALVTAYDPVVRSIATPGGAIEAAASALEALEGADAALLVTEWPEIVSLDWQAAAKTMRGHVLLDGRNAVSDAAIAGTGLRRIGVGVPEHTDG